MGEINLVQWCLLGVAALIGFLLLRVRMKDRQLQELKTELLKNRHAHESEKVEAEVKDAEAKAEKAKSEFEKVLGDRTPLIGDKPWRPGE